MPKEHGEGVFEGPVCCQCGDPTREVEWIPSPFAQEIYGDDTCYWICEECAYESAMDV